MRNAVLLELIDRMPDKKIRGKKAFQKLVYFLQHRDVPLGFRYVLHFYGPYSFALADYTRRMEMDALINMTYKGDIVTISRGLSGSDLLETSRSTLDKKVRKKVSFVVENLGGQSPRALELLATTHFIALNARQNLIRKEDLISWVKGKKQDKFSEAEILRAADRLVELGFLRRVDPIANH